MVVLPSHDAVVNRDEQAGSNHHRGGHCLLGGHHRRDVAHWEVSHPEAALLKVARERRMAVEIVRPGEWLTWQGRA
jgi:hypothetical protein